MRRGRPRVFFCLRARSRPIAIRSLIRFRSSSATAPSTVKIIFPIGVDVSTDSLRDTKSVHPEMFSDRDETLHGLGLGKNWRRRKQKQKKVPLSLPVMSQDDIVTCTA